jgi:hypothetical protein
MTCERCRCNIPDGSTYTILGGMVLCGLCAMSGGDDV